MKSTGIVRRIDDLGRVVIPMEIRKTMHMEPGTSLEIFTGSEGEIIVKKYSHLIELDDFSAQFADLLRQAAGYPVLICDQDRVVAASGIPKREILKRRVSADLYSYMESQKDIAYASDTDSEKVCPVEGSGYFALYGMPLAVGEDVFGYIMLVTDQDRTYLKDADAKLTQLTAAFITEKLGKARRLKRKHLP